MIGLPCNRCRPPYRRHRLSESCAAPAPPPDGYQFSHLERVESGPGHAYWRPVYVTAGPVVECSTRNQERTRDKV